MFRRKRKYTGASNNTGATQGNDLGIAGVRRNKKLSIVAIFIAVALLVTAAIVGYTVYQDRQDKQEEIAESLALAKEDFAGASDDEIEAVASMEVDAAKEPDAAAAKARALEKTDNRDEALRVFDELLQVNPSANYAYDYALAAARSGDIVLSIQVFDRAIKLIEEDTSLSVEVKKSEVERLTRKRDLIREEAGL